VNNLLQPPIKSALNLINAQKAGIFIVEQELTPDSRNIPTPPINRPNSDIPGENILDKTSRNEQKRTVLPHPETSKPHYKPGGGINRRSPPVLTLRTGPAVIPVRTLRRNIGRCTFCASLWPLINNCPTSHPWPPDAGITDINPQRCTINGTHSAPHSHQRSDSRIG